MRLFNGGRGGVHRRWRHGFWLVALSATLLVLAGCGGSDESEPSENSGSGQADAANANVEEAKKRLAAASAEPEWKAPGPAFDASKAEGKKVLYIGVNAAVPVVQTWYKALREAGRTAGMQVDLFDGKGQVSEFNRGVESAIAGGYDAVVLASITPEVVSGAVADANKKGIAVIDVVNHDPGKPLAGSAADVSFCYSCAGKLIADAVIADSGGSAKGTIFTASEQPSSIDEIAGMEGELEELCPDCDFGTEDVAIADWAKRLPTVTRSLLTSQPDTEYIMALYDGMAISMVPAIEQAGKDVKIASFNATPAVMDMMAQGDVVVANVGGANDWLGWGIADQLLRVLSGEEPVADENIPLRMFTKDNLDLIDISAPESTWYGDVDFRAHYTELWGLAK